LDFLTEQEISVLLAELGISQYQGDENCVLLNMDDSHVVEKHCLDNPDCLPCGGDEETRCFDMPTEAMVESVVGAIHKIHEGRTLMLPVGKWRSVFDAVAFSMAEDEPWQEFDASATIKLNTRDPLLFESGDEHTLIELVKSLMNNGESAEQGVFVIPVGAPLLIHLQPSGPVKFWFGNSVLADEIRASYAS
jgi:hypothetical protein